jgi:hypothetical protein
MPKGEQLKNAKTKTDDIRPDTNKLDAKATIGTTKTQIPPEKTRLESDKLIASFG